MLAELDPALPRHTAVAAYLHERDGDRTTAARLYAEAARRAPNLAERDHPTRRAAHRARDIVARPGASLADFLPSAALVRRARGSRMRL